MIAALVELAMSLFLGCSMLLIFSACVVVMAIGRHLQRLRLSRVVRDYERLRRDRHEELLSTVASAERRHRLTIAVGLTCVPMILFFVIPNTSGALQLLYTAVWCLFFPVVILREYRHPLRITLDPPVDKTLLRQYDCIAGVINNLSASNTLWQPVDEQLCYWKTNAGENYRSIRMPASVIHNWQSFLTGVGEGEPIGIKLYGQLIYALPEGLLVISGRHFGLVEYSDLCISTGTLDLVEFGRVPRDTVETDKRWLNIRRDGGPDRRYKYNRRVPVCRYGRVEISSGSGLRIVLICSNPNIAMAIKGIGQP
jgi:hypothetical protein